jgi:hypothetical protein
MPAEPTFPLIQRDVKVTPEEYAAISKLYNEYVTYAEYLCKKYHVKPPVRFIG